MEEKKVKDGEIKEEVMMTEEEAKELLESISKNKDDLTYLADPIGIDIESITSSEKFIEGLQYGLKYAGIFSALINAGMSLEFAEQTVSSKILMDTQNEFKNSEQNIRENEAQLL